jgi:hypothetical protein
MSYNITLTNGNLFAVVSDGTVNTDSSMTLIGRNFAGYGQIQDDNFIRLLETGANDTAPGSPLKGQLWYNTSSNSLQVYNGTAFKSISGAISSATAPSTGNSTGDLWYDTVNQQLNIWSGSAWVLVGPTRPTGTGAAATFITDGSGTAHHVIELTVDGNIVGIVSQDAAFAPAPSIAGFGNVYPGITLSTTVNNQLPQFVGTATSATNANALNGLASTSFMRTDQNTSTTGLMQILNGGGLAVGNNDEFTANVVANSTVNLYNNATNGNLNIGVRKGGTRTAVIQIEGSTGNVILTGNLAVQGTTTTFSSNAVTTNDLFINVANNASSSSQADGGGIGVGPAAAEYASLTFNNATTSWNMSIPLSVTGTVSGSNVLTSGTLSVGGSTTLTGVATAPTAANGVSNTQIATTAFVSRAVNNATGSLGTMATQNATAVNISGGTISGLGTALPVASGGTGLTSPGTSGNIITSNGSGFTSVSPTSAVRGLGYGGSTWHDVTGSRSQGVTYYNTYGYPIQVSGNFGCNGGGQGYIYIDGVLISFWQAQFNGCGGFSVNMPCIVPAGSSYQLANMGGSARGWYELY